MADSGKSQNKGRGARENTPNRFELTHYEPIPLEVESESGTVRTHVYEDQTRSIISTNNSPDVGFDASLNPYRGCEHGCSYCYARPSHEYLGLSAGLDFETKIFAKKNAAEILRRELTAKKWQPQVLALSGVTDAYQPIERQLQITRGCLEVLAECCNPVAIITKNHLVTRDMDHLAKLAHYHAASVMVTITTLNADLRQRLEPRTSHFQGRLDAIRELKNAGIPVGVFVAPVIPGLTDHELPAIIQAGADAGAQFAGYTLLRLPLAVASLFEQWLSDHVPQEKEKVLSRLRSLRGGKLNESRFGLRMKGTGEIASTIKSLFEMARRKAGLPEKPPALSTAAFRTSPWEQLTLFPE